MKATAVLRNGKASVTTSNGSCSSDESKPSSFTSTTPGTLPERSESASMTSRLCLATLRAHEQSLLSSAEEARPNSQPLPADTCACEAADPRTDFGSIPNVKRSDSQDSVDAVVNMRIPLSPFGRAGLVWYRATSLGLARPDTFKVRR
eukprot:TRINITY_DN68381_c0_g1_i1.p2 TRINITY_DN68381_c0_g1~~TRINITY_DN68381_c0_g1_i1.p2  ORF type:complete len:148 (-),score=18.71 TRINITY_DN68381_c0_g1_i1:305-748(-)